MVNREKDRLMEAFQHAVVLSLFNFDGPALSSLDI